MAISETSITSSKISKDADDGCAQSMYVPQPSTA